MRTISDGFVAGVSKLNATDDSPALSLVVRPPVAVVRWFAPCPTIELSEAGFEKLLAHPQFRPHFGVVSDWRGAKADADPHFDRDFLAALGKLQADGRLQGRWATVVPASAQMIDLYRAGRTIEILGRPVGLRYEVFVNYEDAIAWASHSRPARKRRGSAQ